MNILFICKHNKFRSKIAEAFFKKLNKNKKHKTKSAGIIRGSRIGEKIKKYAKEYKLKINSQPRSLTTDLIRWADLIVIAADNVPKYLFSKKKIKVWKIPDTSIEEDNKVKNIIKQIEIHVIKLIREIN